MHRNQCIEINAHSLIYAILKLRKNQGSKDFHTSLFASQPCENIFRQMRSLGSANFTKINFSLYELLHMISRVELMNSISRNDGIISFKKNATNEKNAIELPTFSEIIATMEKARNDALEDARKFGMKFETSDVASCPLRTTEVDSARDSESEFFLEEDDHDEDLFDDSEEEYISKTVQIENDDGTLKDIRKSTLVWLLTESKGKLSSDRLKRVQTTIPENNPKRRRFDSESPRNLAQSSMPCRKMMEIEIGQWCIFEHISENTNGTEHCPNILDMVSIGYVADFKYIKQNRRQEELEEDARQRPKQRQIYNLDYVEISKKSSEKMEALGSWYRLDTTGSLQPIIPKNCFFIPLKNYLCTIMVPIIKQDQPQTNNLIFQGNISEITNNLIELYEFSHC